MDKRKCSEFVDSLSHLGTRMNINNSYGDNNLSEWLVENLNVKKGERILDIGCGSGENLSNLAKIVDTDNHCMGIDGDAEIIAKARQNTKDVLPRMNFLVMDMDTIGDKNNKLVGNKFDLVYSVYAFYYSKDETKLLGNLKDKLTENGRISIIGPYSDNNIDWFNFLEKFMILPESIIASTTTFMENVLSYAKNNFKNVDTKEFVNNIEMPSVEALREYWVSNIYYEPKYNDGFEKYATLHFKDNKEFCFFKKAEMITMSSPK